MGGHWRGGKRLHCGLLCIRHEEYSRYRVFLGHGVQFVFDGCQFGHIKASHRGETHVDSGQQPFLASCHVGFDMRMTPADSSK